MKVFITEFWDLNRLKRSWWPDVIGSISNSGQDIPLGELQPEIHLSGRWAKTDARLWKGHICKSNWEEWLLSPAPIFQDNFLRYGLSSFLTCQICRQVKWFQIPRSSNGHEKWGNKDMKLLLMCWVEPSVIYGFHCGGIYVFHDPSIHDLTCRSIYDTDCHSVYTFHRTRFMEPIYLTYEANLR
jgi:hypothetical protein